MTCLIHHDVVLILVCKVYHRSIALVHGYGALPWARIITSTERRDFRVGFM